MKIYIASLVAFSDLIYEEGPPGTLSMSMPALIPAESIDQAAEKARVFAFKQWKPEEGWHTHQGNIMAVTREFYESVIAADRAGTLDMSEEEPLTFNWD